MRPKTIVIVDDDQDDRELLKEVISTVDSTVIIHTLSGGQHTLDFLNNCDEEKLPSIILLDYNMPLMNGKQLLQKILSIDRYKQIPIVVFSTSMNKKHIDECLDNGARQYFTKPYDYIELKSMIREILALAS
jgi:CheY-like chemotaxis protein